MEVCFEERRELFYRDVERGDMLIGRINSVRDFGLFVTLLCTAGGLERDIEDLEIKVGSKLFIFLFLYSFSCSSSVKCDSENKCCLLKGPLSIKRSSFDWKSRRSSVLLPNWGFDSRYFFLALLKMNVCILIVKWLDLIKGYFLAQLG